MGLFDRFAAKNTNPEPGTPASEPNPEKKPAPGGVLPQLAAAREKLKGGDLPAAMAIYESVLATASERSDILMTISADLGTKGHVREIIELLAPRYDLDKHGAAAGTRLGAGALAALQAYAWPGNVRELENMVERALILSGGGVLEAGHFLLEARYGESWPATPVVAAPAVTADAPKGAQPLTQAVEELEASLIDDALARAEGNKAKAAALLDISERTLWYKLKKYRPEQEPD